MIAPVILRSEVFLSMFTPSIFELLLLPFLAFSFITLIVVFIYLLVTKPGKALLFALGVLLAIAALFTLLSIFIPAHHTGSIYSQISWLSLFQRIIIGAGMLAIVFLLLRRYREKNFSSSLKTVTMMPVMPEETQTAEQKIMQMLHEGKITPEESNALFAALQNNSGKEIG